MDESVLVLGLTFAAIYAAGVVSDKDKKKTGKYRERIKGGLAAGRRPSDFNKKQLARGTKVELEHTPDRKIAREIAMDHLTEDKSYYRKLAKIEKH
jgi:hypothetical protein